jgi:type I restriction enzyme M protein
VAELAEVQANDYNLNISRYVAPVVDEEQVDIGEVLARLREAERERDEAAKRMDELLAELGYAR